MKFPLIEELNLGGVIVVFDLEFTAWPGSAARLWSGPGEHPEIIQIGAVKARTIGGMTETGNMNRYVRPSINPVLSDYIIGLTGIHQSDIDDKSVPFANAMKEFGAFIGDDTGQIICHGSDLDVLIQNCELNNTPFLLDDKNFVNIRPYFHAALGCPEEAVYSCDLAEAFGLENEEKHHDALGDSRAVMKVLDYLVNTKAPAP
ncbi:MAG TPA: exonuclease domain-containing protein [Rhodospirillales bacterium]|nr:exonuclease domain-containing protein [Rhodospirillales bacterium]